MCRFFCAQVLFNHFFTLYTSVGFIYSPFCNVFCMQYSVTYCMELFINDHMLLSLYMVIVMYRVSVTIMCTESILIKTIIIWRLGVFNFQVNGCEAGCN